VRFYRPAHGARVVEVIVPDPPDPAAVAGFVKTIKDLGRIAIRITDVAGGVGDTMRAVFYHAALALASGGVSAYEIDDAARNLGFKRGPFEMMDAEGLVRVAGQLAGMGKLDFMPGLSPQNLLQARIDAGATGQNAGKGFYLYPKDGPVGRDRAVSSWCEENGDECGWPVSGIVPDLALLSAIVNAAAGLISEKHVQRASDIDVCAVNGLGFDRGKGGPLLQADLKGALQILKALNRLEPYRPDIWRPHPCVQEMVKNGQGFFGRAV
jgi:3-hydroxyacyl-CoA dehydrogenase